MIAVARFDRLCQYIDTGARSQVGMGRAFRPGVKRAGSQSLLPVPVGLIWVCRYRMRWT